MTPEQRCPALSINAPANRGIQIDAEGYSPPHKQEVRIRYNFTDVLSTPDPRRECAFLTLTQQSKDHSNFDTTLACRRCARTVRVQVGPK